MTKWTSVSVATLLAFTGAAYAADTLSATDKAFLTQDALGSSYELQLSQLAERKTDNAAIKSFAEQDVADHTTLNKMAEQIAQANGTMLPTTPTPEKQQELVRLGGLSGESFDAAYLKAMKSINADDKSDFAKEADATSNPQVKSFVKEAQSTDQKHEQIVDKLSAKS